MKRTSIKINRQRGFSLIELLIVVVIIGIIAAIAVPNLLASRRAANEATTVAALRIIHGSQLTYSMTTGNGNFGTMTQLNNSNLLQDDLANATTAATAKSGYIYTLNSFPRTLGLYSVFDCDARPVIHTSVSPLAATGTRRFFIIEAGVLYANTTNAVISVVSQSDRTISGATPVTN